MQAIIRTSIMITLFVMMMMLIIEYINVQTSGNWSKPLKKKKWLQFLVAALLGAVPGCMGVYTVVSLFTHEIVGFGALVSAMIATSGDEAFVMFAMIPQKAIVLSVFIFLIAILSGWLVDKFYKKNFFIKKTSHQFHIHKNEVCDCFNSKKIVGYIRHMKFSRAFVLIVLLLFGMQLFMGSKEEEKNNLNQQIFAAPVVQSDKESLSQTIPKHEIIQKTDIQESTKHQQMNFPKVIFIIMTIVSLFIVLTTPPHFIDEHLLQHILKKHFLKIFLWTFGTLFFIYILNQFFDIQNWTSENLWLVLLIAVFIGIIPESGPHMIFISLFFAGAIPFSILIANSIVQDGHGSLPLLAENKKAFLHMKIINLVVGALVGVAGLLLGI